MSARLNGGEKRRTEILNSAEEVFAIKGIDQARMEDIAQHTKLGKGTLYLYFKSKDSLIIAIMERMFAGAFERLEKSVAMESSAENAILQFTTDAIRAYKNMLRITPMVFEFLSLAFRNKTVQKAMRQYLSAYMKALVPIIQRGIDTKEFRQVDAQEVAIAAGAILEGTVLLWAYDRKLIDVDRHIRSSVRLLLNGVLTHA